MGLRLLISVRCWLMSIASATLPSPASLPSLRAHKSVSWVHVKPWVGGRLTVKAGSDDFPVNTRLSVPSLTRQNIKNKQTNKKYFSPNWNNDVGVNFYYYYYHHLHHYLISNRSKDSEDRTHLHCGKLNCHHFLESPLALCTKPLKCSYQGPWDSSLVKAFAKQAWPPVLNPQGSIWW